MSQPEISRRCLSCGASVRAAARFCPQCGATMKDDADTSPAANQAADVAAEAPSRREVASAFETWREEALRPPSAKVEEPEKVEGETGTAARSFVEESSPRAESASTETAGVAASSPAPLLVQSERLEEVDEGVGVSNVQAAGDGEGVVAGGAKQRRRAGAVVKENIMPRVGRMRDEALVVLEETPDDAGLRFVAAAVVLFLLFLLLLFLSTVLK